MPQEGEPCTAAESMVPPLLQVAGRISTGVKVCRPFLWSCLLHGRAWTDLPSIAKFVEVTPSAIGALDLVHKTALIPLPENLPEVNLV